MVIVAIIRAAPTSSPARRRPRAGRRIPRRRIRRMGGPPRLLRRIGRAPAPTRPSRPPAFKEYVDLVDWQSRCAMNDGGGRDVQRAAFPAHAGGEADLARWSPRNPNRAPRPGDARVERIRARARFLLIRHGDFHARTTTPNPSPWSTFGIDTVKKDGDVSRAGSGPADDRGTRRGRDRVCGEGTLRTLRKRKSLARAQQVGEYPPRTKAEYVGPEWEGDAGTGLTGMEATSSCFERGVVRAIENDLGGVTLSADGWCRTGRRVPASRARRGHAPGVGQGLRRRREARGMGS